jgi:hypothetical protein
MWGRGLANLESLERKCRLTEARWLWHLTREEAQQAGAKGDWFGELAFPEGEDTPATAAEGAAGLLVALFVAGEFLEPVGAAGFGDAAAAAGVLMPEAAPPMWMLMIFLSLGKARSGVPGRDLRWRR